MAERSGPNRRGPAPAPLKLDLERLHISQNNTQVEDAEMGEVKEEEEEKEEQAEAEDDDAYHLTYKEELELFGPPPPSPRGLPTGRPRRSIATPVGFVPTTNDRYLNPMRERYVPARDANNSPFADIPYTADTEKRRVGRRAKASAPKAEAGKDGKDNKKPASTIRRRREYSHSASASSNYRSRGLPPLSIPLGYRTRENFLGTSATSSAHVSARPSLGPAWPTPTLAATPAAPSSAQPAANSSSANRSGRFGRFAPNRPRRTRE